WHGGKVGDSGLAPPELRRTRAGIRLVRDRYVRPARSARVQRAPVTSYQLRIHEAAAYLHIVVTGPNTTEVVRGYLREIVEICASRRAAGVLIEQNLAGPGLKLGEIYNIVSEGSEYPLAHQLNVAFVNLNTDHSLASMKFAETVARNRGVNVRAFPSVEAAVAGV